MMSFHKTEKDTADAADSEGAAIARVAAAWVVRRDRKLSAHEMISFERWLAADARHADALARAEAGWGGLDFIPETLAQSVLTSVNRRRRLSFFVSVPLAAAAALAFGLWLSHAPRGAEAGALSLANMAALLAEAAPTQHTLPDGSSLSLNQGAQVVEAFTEGERRLRLLRGEAYFSVSKDLQRPFVVEIGDVEVRAVGTAFNVNLHSTSLEVLVTEGVVELGARQNQDVSSAQPLPSEHPVASPSVVQTLHAHQHARVVLVSDSLKSQTPTVSITRFETEEIAQAIAWQEPLQRLRGTTLAELAVALEQRTGQRVVFADTQVGELRLGGRFRADDSEGFVSVLSTLLDVEVERMPTGELVVRKKMKESHSGK